MTRTNHILITGAALSFTGDYRIVIGGIIGSLIPDLDKKVGLEHRTWTHFWPFYALPLCFIWWGHVRVSDFIIGLFLGALLHIVEDSLTVMGVPVLWPVPNTNIRTGVLGFKRKRRFSFGLFKTGSFLEHMITIGILVAVALIWVNYYNFNRYIG